MSNLNKAQEEMLEKTITQSDFLNGGLLNTAQQNRFVVLVKQFQVMLNEVRYVRMTRPSMEIDKLHIGKPITRGATEGSTSSGSAEPLTNKVTLDTTDQKVRSDWETTTESLQANIEQNDFEGTLMNTIIQRISTDLEMLAIQGDTTITGTNDVDLLLKVLDGWDVQTENAHIVDAAGAEIQKGIWREAKRTMPKQFRNDPGLRWWCSDTLADDWTDLLSDRQTAVGDAALRGVGINPLGIPMVRVPLIPDDKALTMSVPTPATILETKEEGPRKIETGVNDTIIIDVDNVGAVTVTLSAGTWTLVEICKQINTQLVAGGLPAIAKDDGMGRLLLTSETTGATSEIDVQAGSTAVTTGTLRVGSGANGIVVANVVTGAATGGTIYEGTFIWLSNAMNFIFGMLDATRVFTEYNRKADQIEATVFNQLDVKVENYDAMVKVKNIRQRSLIS